MALSYSCLANQARPRSLYAMAYLGSRRDGLVVVGDGLVVLLLGEPGVAAVVVRHGELGVEADRLVVVGDGLVVLPLGVPGVAAVVVRHGELGVEGDRLVVVGDGLVVLLLGEPGEAAVVVRHGELGVEGDRLVVVGDGLVVLLLGEPDEAAAVVRPGELGVEARSPGRSRRWPCRTPPWEPRRGREQGACMSPEGSPPDAATARTRRRVRAGSGPPPIP